MKLQFAGSDSFISQKTRFPRPIHLLVGLGVLVSGAAAQQPLYQGPLTSTLSGASLSTLSDCDNDGVRDFAIARPNEATNGLASGNVQVLSGATGVVLYEVQGPGGSGLGTDVASVGDLNGDGIGDWVAGAPYGSDLGMERGFVRAYSGSSGVLLYEVGGIPGDQHFGFSICGTTDEDGDGVRDFAVSVPGIRVAIHSGRTGAAIREVLAPATEPNFGREISYVGDWDNDGDAEIIASSPGSTFGDNRVMLLRGGESQATWFVSVDDSSETAELELALVDDWNGDGLAEFAILARPANTVSIVSRFGGIIRTIQLPSEFNLPTLAALGDVTGDGVDDIAIGSRDEGPFDLHNGAVRVYEGGSGAQVLSLIGPFAAGLSGSEFGTSVCALDDVNLDGRADFVVLQRSSHWGVNLGYATAFTGAAGSLAGDTCDNPILVPSTGSIDFDTSSFTPSGADFGVTCDAISGKDVFFLWYQSSNASLTTEGSSFDTILSVLGGTDCDAECKFSNDNASAGDTHSSLYCTGEGFSEPELRIGRLVRVGGNGLESGPGQLSIVNSSLDCISLAEDAFAGNHSCEAAAEVTETVISNLVAFDGAPDFFRVCVKPFSQFSVWATYEQNNDIDVTFWHDSGSDCGDESQWTPLALSFSNNFEATTTWYNNTGVRQEIAIKVKPSEGVSCSSYDLFFGFVPAPTCPSDFGTAYCGALTNSTGLPGELRLTGSDVVVDGDLVLSAEQIPLNQFVLFLASQGQGFVAMPGGSEGNLCLGGGASIARLHAQVGAASAGFHQAPLEFNSIPDPVLGSLAVQAGQTWNFQAWYRDGNSSNFTNAVSIDFQ